MRRHVDEVLMISLKSVGLENCIPRSQLGRKAVLYILLNTFKLPTTVSLVLNFHLLFSAQSDEYGYSGRPRDLRPALRQFGI
jgi:hypothetical protein